MARLHFSRRDLLMPALLAVFFLIFYLVYEDIKDRTTGEFNNEQLILARTAAQGMTSFFEEHQSFLLFLSENKEIVNFTEEGDTLLSGFYSTHKSIIEAVTRVDADGIIRYTCPRNESVIGSDISYQSHVQEVRTTQKPVVSDVFLSAQGYPAIALHVPVFRDEVFAGSLAILIPIDKLGKRYLGNIRNRGTGNVRLLSEKGVEIYSPFPGYAGKTIIENKRGEDSDRELNDIIKEQSSGTVKGIYSEADVTGKRRSNGEFITFFRSSLGNTYWTILISYHEKDIYAAIARLRNRLILVFSLLFVTMLYFFYSLSRVSNVLRLEARRKEAEKTLMKSEEKFRRLFDDHLMVKLLIDPDDGAIVDANKAASDYYGWTREELKGMKISQINTLSDVELVRKMENVKSRQENQFEARHLLKNGSCRDVEVFSSVIEIEGKEMLHSILYDITFRKQVEEDLIKARDKAEEADRLKTAFLQNMSHEIRTPMNAIIGFSSILVDCYNDKSKLEDYSAIISQSSTDLLLIIDDILDISKIESGQLTVYNEECILKDFFAEISEFFYGYQRRSGKQQIRIKLEAPDDPSLQIIIADRVKLRQIFVNLVSNAFKYTDSGKIEGGCRLDEKGNLVFYVSDTGIGIPAQKLEFVFERFAQVDFSGEKVISGTGLGLSIAKGLVEVMGGDIWVESELDKGTVFYFSVPVEFAETQNKEQVSNISNPVYDFTGKTILLVEDEDFNTIYFKTILADTGLEIIHTGLGREAVHLAVSQSPDVVLMDIRLPDIDGYEATRLIKQQKPGLCIIAQTAYAANDDERKALEAGCNDYISKPIDRELLLDMLKRNITGNSNNPQSGI